MNLNSIMRWDFKMGFPRAVSHWYELVIYRWRHFYYQGLIRMNLFWRFRSRISVAGAKRSRLTPNGWLLCPRPCTRFRAGSQVVNESKFLNRLLGAINVTCVVLFVVICSAFCYRPSKLKSDSWLTCMLSPKIDPCFLGDFQPKERTAGEKHADSVRGAGVSDFRPAVSSL